MDRKTVLDNEFATLWYYPGAKIVHHQIKKFIFGKPLQELLSKGTETLRQNKAVKWLSDDRNNNALTPTIRTGQITSGSPKRQGRLEILGPCAA